LLLSSFQLLDNDELVVASTRQRLLLECIRFDLVSLKSDKPGCLPRKEAEKLFKKAVQQGDTLQGSWPWKTAPQLIVTNPPWLRIKDRFRGMEEGSKLRRELGEQLRSLSDNGVPRFSTMRGNVNLYRLFIERGLQILHQGGRLRLIAPDSILREQSSHPLRQLLVEEHGWSDIWAIEEANHLFPGMTQGVAVLGITAKQEVEKLVIHGPISRADLRRDLKGLANRVPSFEMEQEGLLGPRTHGPSLVFHETELSVSKRYKSSIVSHFFPEWENFNTLLLQMEIPSAFVLEKLTKPRTQVRLKHG
jgi:hypothetical protein